MSFKAAFVHMLSKYVVSDMDIILLDASGGEGFRET